ncbi:MAG: class I SAM-dependent methyltransferase [Nitrososphaerales archaeon]
MLQVAEEQGFGLKEDWKSIEETLRELIPVYDKTNRYISLGSDLKLRRDGLCALRKALRKDSFSILDLGCGPGKMTQMLSLEDSSDSVLTDALPSMVRLAKSRNPLSTGVVSVYENLPFREGSFDTAMAGFAIRDARRLLRALREIHSTLKNDGIFLIVDLCKPDSTIRRGLIGTYWRLLAPLIALFASGRLGLKFAALFTTYRRLPKNSEFEKLLGDSGFEIQEREYRMLGGACIMLLIKR